MKPDAKESPAVKRARKKLLSQFAEQDKKVNETSLEQIKRMIHASISRYDQERTPLSDRQLAVFDENKHPEKAKSKHVRQLMSNLSSKQASSNDQGLKGRIKPKN